MKKLFLLSLLSITSLHGMTDPGEERTNSLVFQGNKVIVLHNKETHLLLPACEFNQIYYTLILNFASCQIHHDPSSQGFLPYLIDPKYVIENHDQDNLGNNYSVSPMHCCNISDCNPTPVKNYWNLKTHAIDRKTGEISPHPRQEIYHFPLIVNKTLHYMSKLLPVALGVYIYWVNTQAAH